MQRTRLVYGAKCGVVFGAIALAIYAHSMGPDPRKTGAPGDTTCNQAGCHIGTAVNSSNGKVEITYSGGTSYTPGERGKFTVVVTDAAQRRFGFQASARLASNESNGQAGDLIAGANQFVQCENGRPKPCASNGVQFVNHSQPGTTGTFEFEWTAPDAGAGDVVVYVAGNAANGNGNEMGDRIYTSSIRLSQAGASSGNKPAVTSGGVANTWSASQTIATNTWISIFGSNFTTETKDWNGSSEFSQGKLPLALGGVSVTVGGKTAPVYFISPGQINVLVPDDTQRGNLPLVVKNAAGESTPVTVSRADYSPALLTTPVDGRLHVIGRLNSNANTVLGLLVGQNARPFAPGDVVQFYATGLGPTTPALAVENVVTGAPSLNNAPQIFINNVPVQILGSVLTGSGLYQVNGTIPQIADGEYPAVIEVGGTRSPDNIVISIKR